MHTPRTLNAGQSPGFCCCAYNAFNIELMADQDCRKTNPQQPDPPPVPKVHTVNVMMVRLSRPMKINGGFSDRFKVRCDRLQPLLPILGGHAAGGEDVQVLAQPDVEA